MGAQKPKSDNLADRFLEYLQEERAIEVSRKKDADRTHLDASKRIRELDKEIAIIKGGAL